ncbi:hypothetical protein Tco_1140187 [Tanacetum coccineum]
MDGNRTGKSMDGNQTAKPVEKNQTCKPLKPDQRSKTVKAGQESKPVKMDQNSKPVNLCEEAIPHKLSISKNDVAVEKKAQATKPLLAMIEEYRSVAASLQPRNKKVLIKACKEVEQYLEAHSSKDLDQIGWSNFIKETMDIFKRLVSGSHLIN